MTNDNLLPASVCRICGTAIKAGKGAAAGLPSTSTEGAAPEVAAEAMREHRRAVAAAQMVRKGITAGWSRTCSDCVGIRTVADVLAVLLPDHDLTDREVSMIDSRELPLAEFVLRNERDEEEVKRRAGRPWKHVGGIERERLDREIDRVKRITRPSVDPRGACGICGVRVSVGWHDAPTRLTWPDGSPAPVCSTCYAEWSRYQDRTLDRLRGVAYSLATGSRRNEAEEMRIYAEVPGADGNGYAGPFMYSERIEEIRGRVWLVHPDLAPEDRRPEFEEKRRARLAEIAAEKAKEAAATAW